MNRRGGQVLTSSGEGRTNVFMPPSVTTATNCHRRRRRRLMRSFPTTLPPLPSPPPAPPPPQHPQPSLQLLLPFSSLANRPQIGSHHSTLGATPLFFTRATSPSRLQITALCLLSWPGWAFVEGCICWTIVKGMKGRQSCDLAGNLLETIWSHSELQKRVGGQDSFHQLLSLLVRHERRHGRVQLLQHSRLLANLCQIVLGDCLTHCQSWT